MADLKPEWRPIETCPNDVEVMFWWPYWSDKPFSGRYDGKIFDSDCNLVCTYSEVGHEGCPTHWMPLPEPPKGECK